MNSLKKNLPYMPTSHVRAIAQQEKFRGIVNTKEDKRLAKEELKNRGLTKTKKKRTSDPFSMGLKGWGKDFRF